MHEDSKVEVHSGIARHLLKPLEANPSQPDVYGELRYQLEGEKAFFTFNAQGLRGENYYGLYSVDRQLSLGYAVKSSKLSIQGFRPSEIMKEGDFRLCSVDMGIVRLDEQVLK